MIGNISPGQLIIIALIVLLLFGSRKLRHLGADLGEAYRGFRKALNSDPSSCENAPASKKSSLDSRE